jgi:hypothetical protein
VKSNYAQQLLVLLTQDASLDEIREEKFLISQIKEHQSALAARQEPIIDTALRRLSSCRLCASSSLRRCPQSLTQWHKAQKLLESWLKHDKNINLEDIIKLNFLLSASPKAGFRTTNIYTSMVKHVDPGELEAMMDYFFAFFQKSKSKGSLYQAFVCRYWICSIHPFADANGRTSQLVADYILLQNNMLPQAYFSLLEALIIADPLKKSYMTPHQAFKKFAQTIINAYLIIAPSAGEK